jgi:Zn-dependent protease
MIWLFIKIVLVLFISIILHELGHLIVMREFLQYTPKIQWKNKAIVIGEEIDYMKLGRKEYIMVMLCGIVSGAVPLLAFEGLLFSILLAIYALFGCKNDLLAIAERMKR